MQQQAAGAFPFVLRARDSPLRLADGRARLTDIRSNSRSLYRLADLKPRLDRIAFPTPNTLEALMDAKQGAVLDTRPSSSVFARVVAFCNPVKHGADEWVNRAGQGKHHTIGKLAELFTKGYRIDAFFFGFRGQQSCTGGGVFPFLLADSKKGLVQGINEASGTPLGQHRHSEL